MAYSAHNQVYCTMFHDFQVFWAFRQWQPFHIKQKQNKNERRIKHSTNRREDHENEETKESQRNKTEYFGLEHWTLGILNSEQRTATYYILLFVWYCVSLWHVVLWQKRYHVHVHIILFCYSVVSTVDMRCLLLQNIATTMLKTGKTRLHIAHEAHKRPNWIINWTTLNFHGSETSKYNI